MQHLLIERLVELADGEPTAAEREHLGACAMCTAERTAYQRVVAMAADERRRIAPPLTDWGSLRGELRTRGIISTPDEAASRRLWSARVASVGGRIAAAVAILAVGIVSGRLSTGMSVTGAMVLGGGPGDESTVATVSQEDFASTAAALQVLQRAQQEYERAALYLANHDTSVSEVASELLRTRLAALDEMAETSRRALGNSPADPIMNQVYLTTLGARNMTLGRLASALPVGSRLSRF
ncbi:MAG TPA: hypothetical protein VF981_02055 [Gemmatimonadaceae bacterium]